MEEYKRALAVALRYITHSDRTEGEVKKRLLKDEFGENVISEVLEELKNDGYINDLRYARYYLVCYKDKRSRKRIESDLYNKGVDSNIIEICFDEIAQEKPKAVFAAIKKQMIKRGIESLDKITYEDRNKISAALYRQGYSSDEIRNAFDDGSVCL